MKDTLSIITMFSLLALCQACGDEPATQPPQTRIKQQGMAVLEHDQWQVNGYICPPSGWRAELDTLFVDTGICDPFEGQQPLTVALQPEDVLEISLWHLNLTAPEPAQATIHLTLDEHVVWSKSIDIPSPGQSYTVRWSPPFSIEVGASWSLSIANHGGNHWRMKTIRLVECGGCRE